PDEKYFVMKLRDGHQYSEPRAGSRGSAASPFVRTNFKVWTRVFDLSEFDLQRTNEDLFKSNRSMLSVRQLQDAIDSMAVQELDRQKASTEQVAAYIAPPAPDTSAVAQDSAAQSYQPRPPVRDTAGPQLWADTSMQAGVKKEAKGAIKIAADTDSLVNVPVQIQDLPQQTFTGSLANLDPNAPQGIRQEITQPLNEYESLVKTFIAYEQPRLVQSALTQARSLMGQAEANVSILSRMKKNRVKFIYDLHMKYVFAAMCVVFLFIGAPMGAIVRKGGFGFPILIATIFFVLFIILTIFCRKIAEAFIVPGNLAAWLPCLLFIPLGMYLTVKAMNDSEVFRFEAIGHLWRRLRPAKKEAA
ncbi:MAG TPA: LptF/LptG family permease, partial [Saprospiraceae bacterium]|nr:LptF/LptG family permease [Saprospiraceae bacterium]